MQTHQSIRFEKAHQDALCPRRRLVSQKPRHIPGCYLHVPFCFHKCHYCDFYSIVDREDRQARFTDRLIAEIQAWSPCFSRSPQTLFVGGGTPTLLAPELWKRLLKAVKRFMHGGPQSEFTVEANPETVTDQLLAILADGGVSRLSIGAQSFKARHLKTLERWHEIDNVARAMERARQAGITNLNLDLIFAIPGQTLEDWLSDLRAALSLRPTHLSCYALTYEPNTPLHKKAESGRVVRCDEQLEMAMYQATIETLSRAGYDHYEISNFALMKTQNENPKSFRCQHNLNYWHNENWLAFGPSAAGHVDGLRWKNVARLADYLDSTGPSPAEEIEQLDEERSIGEQIMLRLRLTEGIERAWIEPRLNRWRREKIDAQIERGLLECTDTHLRLTRPGMLLADSVIGELL